MTNALNNLYYFTPMILLTTAHRWYTPSIWGKLPVIALICPMVSCLLQHSLGQIVSSHFSLPHGELPSSTFFGADCQLSFLFAPSNANYIFISMGQNIIIGSSCLTEFHYSHQPVGLIDDVLSALPHRALFLYFFHGANHWFLFHYAPLNWILTELYSRFDRFLPLLWV